MIHVTYDGKYTLSLIGHAGQAPAGQDIVCAGASALIYSLSKMLQRHKDECLRLEILVENGNGSIAVQPSLAFANGCQRAFETVLCGFEEIAEQYPDYITLHRSDV